MNLLVYGTWLASILHACFVPAVFEGELSRILERLEGRVEIPNSEQRNLIERGFELNPNEAEAARLWLNQGHLYADAGDCDSARDSLAKAEAVAVSSGDRDTRRSVLMALGAVDSSCGGYASAMQRFKNALQMDIESGDVSGQARLLTSIGRAHCDLGDSILAIESMGRAGEFLGDKPGTRLQAELLADLGAAYCYSGDSEQGKLYLRRALRIQEEIQEPTRYVTLNSLGNSHTLDGEYAEALKVHQEALELAMQSGAALGIERAELNVGIALVGLERHAEAAENLTASADWFRAHNQYRELGAALIGLGIALEAKGQPDQAGAAFLAARNATLGDKVGVQKSESLVKMARVHESMGNNERALELLHEAHESLRFWDSGERERAMREFEAKYQRKVQDSRLQVLESDAAVASFELERLGASRRNLIRIQSVAIVGLIGLLLMARWRSKAINRLNTEGALLRDHRFRLQAALAEVESLRGLLPICAHCKCIRSSSGVWAAADDFFEQRADVSFTHSVCASCSEDPSRRKGGFDAGTFN